MLSIDTYEDLAAAIADYLNKKNLGEKIPLFIKLAEQVIFRELRCPANEKVGLYTGVTRVVDYPSDLLEIKLATFNGKPLERITDAQMAEKLDENSSGSPMYFSRKLAKLYVYPLPQEPGELELQYYADYSNEFTAPSFNVTADLYLFGSLAEAYSFMKKPDEAQFWNSRFMRAIQDLNDHAIEAELAGSSLTVEGAYDA